MDCSRNRVPDGIEPIIGYRLWIYSFGLRRAKLHSLNPDSRCHGREWDGAGSGWAIASCLDNDDPGHVAPVEDCSCGLYSFSSLPHLFADFNDFIAWWTQPDPPGTESNCGVVLGRIQLAGKVIEHDHGYRAERARIAELVPFLGTERRVIRLAARLGLSMGDPMPPTIFHPSMVRSALAAPGFSGPPPKPSSPRRRVKEWVRSEAA
jgi:hypothetical protein